MKTRDKIIQASIVLFNEQGERNVTTNHIAADLGISPGNLYYHFRNKEDIILSIYEEYARNLLIETMPEVSPDVKPLDAILLYMDVVFQAMMKFRFFYSNLPVLLAKNPLLHDKYVEVQGFIAQRVSELLLSLRDAKMMDFSDEDLPDIVSILRLVNTFWLSFYQTQNNDNEINDAVFYQGVLKILVIIHPYISTEAKSEFLEARAMYRQRCQDSLLNTA
ncbi:MULTISPECIES: TetR/AcrR family transcriptional regulator [unclassified Colwellia]|jgi:AcrR family transcriptional regulator|uniref:TetR/AcrR family transcriptional regulator n=1 Tax=unclassified Colwellia TaxID=196834 RepID=UPI000D338975|nr:MULTISPECIES: TetR/AcrR family transcriptional regulator [unclassified Colwellia]AWB59205.1 TetR family transcriptional regulator [Colwellia sp. Arc7-D]MBA6416863.1 TetR/AcrR family transcriptional regulator [Colwellia sp. 6M3]|tara:strand:- start:853 stop:1512 length:660 start_codon:yes stop_codon:yes gene_type:complete